MNSTNENVTVWNSGQSENNLSLGALLYVIFMTLALIFAVLSNGLVIYCVSRLRKLRTVTNIFICNLSVSDILLAGFVMPQRLHDITHASEDFYEGDILCKVVNFCPILAITSSVYTLVFISFERRQAIINTGSQDNSFTPRRLPAAIIFIWTFATAVSCPTLLEYTVYDKNVSDGNHSRIILACGSHFPNALALGNAILVLVVSYIIPVILLTRNYAQLAMFVWRKGNWMRDKTEKQDTTKVRMSTKRQRVVKLLIMVAIIFAVSWLPFFGVLLYAKATGNDASENAGGFVNLSLLALATFSTAYNVVLYVIFNPSFRRAILGVLRCTRTSVLENKFEMDKSQQTPASFQDGDGGTNRTTVNSNSTISDVVSKSEITVSALVDY